MSQRLIITSKNIKIIEINKVAEREKKVINCFPFNNPTRLLLFVILKLALTDTNPDSIYIPPSFSFRYLESRARAVAGAFIPLSLSTTSHCSSSFLTGFTLSASFSTILRIFYFFLCFLFQVKTMMD